MRHSKLFLIIAVLVSCVILLSCTDSGHKTEVDTISYLTEKIGKTNIIRSGEPQIYVGQSLYEYINGGAEIYHMYRFVEVATASYNKDGTEVVADIYRFESSNYAFGLYTTLRPEERESVKIGIDGFASATTIDFVIGEFVLKVYGYDQTPETRLAINVIAAELEKSLPGSRTVPDIYSKLPVENKIAGSEKMYAVSFLGIKGLDEIYSCTYAIGSDTTEVFVAEDRDGQLFNVMREYSVFDANAEAIKRDLHFASKSCAIGIDPYYGNIATGAISGLFIGTISYNDNIKSFLNGWIDSIE